MGHAGIVRRKELDSPLEEVDRLTLGETLQGVLARDRVLLCRARDISCLVEVHRDDGGELALAIWVDREKRLCGELMESATVLLQE